MTYHVKDTQQLLDALAHLAPDSTKTTLRSWIKLGRVLVDGRREQRPSLAVNSGQLITLTPRQQPLVGQGVRLLYGDAHIVAIYKPAGLLSVASTSEEDLTAHAVLKRHYHPKRVYVVHRLDQHTSGVMLFALSEKARDELKITFEKHDITRRYTAIVAGTLPKDGSGTWSSYLYEDDRYVVHSVDEQRAAAHNARLAITHWKVTGQRGGLTKLELQLETGRKNQIRVHCQEAGFPVVGDEKYGYRGDSVDRLGLHAHLLELLHPITGKNMRFEALPPAFFLRMIP